MNNMATPKIAGQTLGVVTRSDLLSELWWQTSSASGGLPATYAVAQDNGSQSFVWTALSAVFLGDENGNVLVDQSGNYLVG